MKILFHLFAPVEAMCSEWLLREVPKLPTDVPNSFSPIARVTNILI